ncbi:MAG: hypothetical protein DCC75_04110 [Proteobacteria bacterium]|nr:MAG: hypothetical protein DCC75_04110 [Pseudomonadota bacterium]
MKMLKLLDSPGRFWLLVGFVMLSLPFSSFDCNDDPPPPPPNTTNPCHDDYKGPAPSADKCLACGFNCTRCCRFMSPPPQGGCDALCNSEQASLSDPRKRSVSFHADSRNSKNMSQASLVPLIGRASSVEFQRVLHGGPLDVYRPGIDDGNPWYTEVPDEVHIIQPWEWQAMLYQHLPHFIRAQLSLYGLSIDFQSFLDSLPADVGLSMVNSISQLSLQDWQFLEPHIADALPNMNQILVDWAQSPAWQPLNFDPINRTWDRYVIYWNMAHWWMTSPDLRESVLGHS